MERERARVREDTLYQCIAVDIRLQERQISSPCGLLGIVVRPTIMVVGSYRKGLSPHGVNEAGEITMYQAQPSEAFPQ